MITYGTNPGMGMPIDRPHPDPQRHGRPEPAHRARTRRWRYMDLQPGQPLLGHQVDVVFIGSCTNSPHLAICAQAAA